LTVERPGSFIVLPMVEIRGTDLELKLSGCVALKRPAFQMIFVSRMIQCDLRVSSKQGLHPEASNATFAFHESHISNKLNTRLMTQKHPRESAIQDQIRVASSTDEIRNFKKTKSDTRVFINSSHIFSFQHQSMSLLLQSVQ